MYDQKHRFIEVADIKNGEVKEGQKGWWEHLLCEKCESRVNRYEKHARRLFVDPLPLPQLADNRVFEIPSLDYKLLKLFVLLVLWRASISTLDFFRHVSLGPHEEEIRKLIISDAFIDPSRYGCLIWALFDGNRHFNDVMIEPTYFKVDGLRCYRFVMRGFVFMIYVGNHAVDNAESRLCIGKHPEVRVYKNSWEGIGFIREAMVQVAQMP